MAKNDGSALDKYCTRSTNTGMSCSVLKVTDMSCNIKCSTVCIPRLRRVARSRRHLGGDGDRFQTTREAGVCFVYSTPEVQLNCFFCIQTR